MQLSFLHKFSKTSLLVISLCALSFGFAACAPDKDDDEPEPSQSLPRIGDACDPDTFVPKCDGKNYIQCNFLSFVDSTSCNETCAEFEGVAKCASEICSTPNESVSTCTMQDSLGIQKTVTCSLKDDNGNYHYTDPERKYCSSVCAENGKDCAKTVKNEGEDCDASTFENYCEGSNYARCEDGKIVAGVCSEGTTCAVIDGTIIAQDQGTDYPYGANNHIALCVIASQTCQKPGKSTTCEEVTVAGISLFAGMTTEFCVSTVDGSAKYKIASETTENCSEGCSDDKKSCRVSNPPADNGSPCDPSTFENRCDNDYTVVCAHDVVTSQYCSGKNCKVIDVSKSYEGKDSNYPFGKDNIAALCEPDIYECADSNQTSLCVSASSLGMSVSLTYTDGFCSKTVDGSKSYFFANEESENKKCNLGCNEEKTDCAE